LIQNKLLSSSAPQATVVGKYIVYI